MPKHANLNSFLKWAYAGNVDQTQAVFRGMLYEFVTQRALQLRFGSAGLGPLKVVAGTGDRGIDLIGEWKGTTPASINVAVQCKSSPTKVPPQLWREMAGVYAQLPLPSLVLLASPLPMTAQARSAFNSFSIPYIHCQVRWAWPIWNKERGRPECAVSASSVLATHANSAATQLLGDSGISLPKVPTARL